MTDGYSIHWYYFYVAMQWWVVDSLAYGPSFTGVGELMCCPIGYLPGPGVWSMTSQIRDPGEWGRGIYIDRLWSWNKADRWLNGRRLLVWWSRVLDVFRVGRCGVSGVFTIPIPATYVRSWSLCVFFVCVLVVGWDVESRCMSWCMWSWLG